MHEKRGIELRVIEEEIMEVLFDLQIDTGGMRVKMGVVLERLGEEITKTQLTNIVRRKLEPLNYVDYLPYEGILLTKKGFQVARRIARNHRLAEALLYQIFDIPFSILHEEACAIEHGITDRMAEYIFQKLKEKTTPFGMPIPMGEIRDLECNDESILDISSGTSVTLTRIINHSVDTAKQLATFDIHSIGVKMLVKRTDEKGVTIEIQNTEHFLPYNLSKSLCVKPED
ncbi:MAG: metal-dependent transcriptional regulator [Candidatus Hodarchaeales archaeon]|jgi:DtxR family Mn-dependent transcriptional regulator